MTREGLRRATRLVAATVVVAIASVSEAGFPGVGAAVTGPPAPGTAPLRMSDSWLARIRGSEAFSPRVYDDGAGNPTSDWCGTVTGLRFVWRDPSMLLVTEAVR